MTFLVEIFYEFLLKEKALNTEKYSLHLVLELSRAFLYEIITKIKTLILAKK